MSVEDEKVCCNCKHCIRSRDEKYDIVVCRCEVNKVYLSYAEVMAGWCSGWELMEDASTVTPEYEELDFIQPHKKIFVNLQPERKKGKWIRWYETKEDEAGTEYIPHCRCSECGTEYDPHSSKFVSFCNVCGADMRGEQE